MALLSKKKDKNLKIHRKILNFGIYLFNMAN